MLNCLKNLAIMTKQNTLNIIVFYLMLQYLLVNGFTESEIKFARTLGYSISELSKNPSPIGTVCYDIVGCFNNNPPFNNAAFYLPISPDKLKTNFQLYTSAIGPDRLNYADENSIRNSKYSKDYPLKIVIHGFQNTGQTPWVIRMINNILVAVRFLFF